MTTNTNDTKREGPERIFLSKMEADMRIHETAPAPFYLEYSRIPLERVRKFEEWLELYAFLNNIDRHRDTSCEVIRKKNALFHKIFIDLRAKTGTVEKPEGLGKV
jgi:hypothetical protein